MSSYPPLLLPPDLSPQLLVSILEREQAYRTSTNKLKHYRPYPKQAEFHADGATFRERLFLAGNRCGKTEAGAMECAMHLTCFYPKDWTGKRFPKPVRMWASGVTGESSRDVVQAKLFGPPDRRSEWGTGAIPHASIDDGHIATGRGISGAIDMASIKHHDASGHFDGWSSLSIKSYERGREKWQGTGLEVMWFDEEPPMDIYLEGLTRTNETGGVVFLTCTPLLGMSSVMMRFLHPDIDSR
jgi:phage terminase large subunit-like protein